MILTLAATVLILAIAYCHAGQGSFSALITTVVTVVCAAFALNFYPALGTAFLYARQGAYADGISLIALFVLPLLVVRFALDWLIRRDVALGGLLDRVGGGVLGLVSGIVLVGMVLVIVQTLPFGQSVLGYRPYNDALKVNAQVWPFRPDRFTVGMARLISAGALSGPDSFDKAHDDFLLEAFCARNTAGKNGSVLAAPDALTVNAAWQPPSEGAEWMAKVPENPLLPPTVEKTKNALGILETRKVPNEVVVVRVSVSKSAVDEDEWWRLPGTQFRLVGASGRDYWPVGYLEVDAKERKYVFVSAPVKEDQLQLAQLIVMEKGKRAPAASVYWVYRIAGNDTPAEMVFRRVARQDVRRVKKGPLPEIAAPPTAPATPKVSPKRTPKPKPKPPRR